MKSFKKVSILSLLVILSSLASCNGNLPGSTASPATPNSTISPTTPKPTPSSTVTKEEFNITTDVDDGATISGLPKKASEGDEVEFQVELEEEKEISYVTIDGENIITPENGVYKFVMPSHAVTVKAVTQDMRYAVNVEQIVGATIAVSSTLAKKGETIKVRIAITDSTKESPVVKAGDIDVPMSLAENETKTFEGSFVEPGSDVSLLVTLSDAPAEYTILDKAGDGAVVVNAPKTAKAGDKVTFSMALDSGFEFAGEVKVTAGDNEVEVMTNDDGTYSFVMPASSVTISQETAASIYKINSTIGEHLKVDVPDYAAFNSKVEFVVPSTNEYEVDKVTLDNVELVADEEGKYSFTMKDRAVSLVVTEKERFAPIILNDSKHLMMTAYTHDEKANTYTPVTQVRWGEKLYIKVTPKAGVNEGDYGIDKLEVKLSENDTRALYTNSDGYYYNPSAVVSDMTYGLQFTLTEVEAIFDANHVIVGSHAGAYINYSYSSGVSLAKTKSNLVADRFGNISFPSSSYSATTTKITSVDDTTKTFKMESTDYEGGWTDNGLIYILSTSTYNNLTYDLVFLQGSTSSNLETEYLADSKDSTPTKYIARLKNDTKDIYVYAEKTSGKKATISEITSIQVANGLTSFTDEGAIFKATINGEDKYFINRNGLLADYSTTNPLTLTGSLGTITTDGICNATVTKGDNTIDTTYSMDGESLTIIINGKKHTLKVDTTTNTYQELKFSAGLYIGGKVSSSHSYYKMELTTDFKGKWESGSNSAITFNDDQTFTFNSYKVLLSDNKDLALVRESSNTYLLSKDITEYSASSVGMEIVGLTNGTLKTGEKFVADIYDANTSSSSLVKKAVYFDGTNYVFGSIKNNTAIDTKGISFIFVTEDNHEINMKNNNGALEIAIDVSGTYTDTDTENNHGKLILSNDGTGTLNNVAITYEVNSKDEVTVKEGNTTYTISLENSTYTITNTKVLVLPAFAGQTFKGKIDYVDEYDEEYGSETYDAYIKFSSSEKTLSFSAGDGASASNVEGGQYLNNKNVEYTYDETSKEITVALKYNNNAHTVVFVYDSTKNTLTPKSQVTFGSFYIRAYSDYAFTKVA